MSILEQVKKLVGVGADTEKLLEQIAVAEAAQAEQQASVIAQETVQDVAQTVEQVAVQAAAQVAQDIEQYAPQARFVSLREKFIQQLGA